MMFMQVFNFTHLVTLRYNDAVTSGTFFICQFLIMLARVH